MRARLTIDIATTEDDVEFVADEARVRQVLYNLLSNAVGFSDVGGLVRVSVWRERGMVAFAVEDDGVGIPKEEQARVFERFESRSQGGKHRGAGLGLPIARSIVELHRGEHAARIRSRAAAPASPCASPMTPPSCATRNPRLARSA